MQTRNHRNSFRTFATIVAFTVCLTTSGTALAHKTPIPEGFNGYLVFMANGEQDPDEPAALLTDEFFIDIMGWSQEELDEYTAERLAFFEERFGIIDPANNPNVVMLTGEEIVIRFQAGQPITPVGGTFGRLSFFCEIENEEWGEGLAQGVSDARLLGEGDEMVLKHNIRNVLTFSDCMISINPGN